MNKPTYTTMYVSGYLRGDLKPHVQKHVISKPNRWFEEQLARELQTGSDEGMRVHRPRHIPHGVPRRGYFFRNGRRLTYEQFCLMFPYECPFY